VAVDRTYECHDGAVIGSFIGRMALTQAFT